MDENSTTYQLHNNEEIAAWRVRKLALFAGKTFMLIHFLFVIFQVLGLLLVPADDMIHTEMLWLAIGGNLFSIAVVFVFWSFNTRQQNNGHEVGFFFRISMLVVSVAILFIWLMHLHIAGSLNSLLLSMILAGLIVVTTFLPSREAIWVFVCGNVAVFTLVGLEYMEVLPYAPLFVESPLLKEVFLDWRSIVMSGTIYLGMISITGIITFKTRSAMEKNSAKIYNVNQNLLKEIDERRRIQNENERLIKELQTALDEVKTLEDLMPICSSCKKIRDDSGYWQQVEGYLHERAGATFTHGLCPECAEKLYPEFVDRETKK